MKANARILLAASAVFSMIFAAAPASADVKAGVDAWQAGNFARAVAEWRPLADQGDADAQFNLGQAYKLGRGVPTDMRIAQSWYEKAANQGHGQSQAILGLIKFQNGDRAGAMPWLRKGADAGDARAQYVLGTAMFNGDLVSRDWPRAYALMTRAAAQGLPQATANLEQMNRFIPLEQRQRGIAIANQMQAAAASPTPAASAMIGTAGPPVRRPGASPAVTAARPTARPAVVASRPVVPPARPAAAPAIAMRPGTGWKIQLGAFGDAGNAQRQWSSLRGRVSALAGLQPNFVRAGTITRLQAGPLASRAAADRVCAAAKAAGSACIPVAP